MFVHNSHLFYYIGLDRAEELEDIMVDKPMNCRYEKSNFDEHALGVCPKVYQ